MDGLAFDAGEVGLVPTREHFQRDRVVVEAGHWFKHKHFLIPIGHIALETGARRLVADVPKARVERFPGFTRSEFHPLPPTPQQAVVSHKL